MNNISENIASTGASAKLFVGENFTIEVPSNWLAVHLDEGQTGFMGPLIGPMRLRFAVYDEEATEAASLYLMQAKRQFEQEVKDWELLDETVSKGEGYDTVVWYYRWYAQELDLAIYVQHSFIFVDGRRFEMTAMQPNSPYLLEIDKLFMEMASSFRLMNVDDPMQTLTLAPDSTGIEEPYVTHIGPSYQMLVPSGWKVLATAEYQSLFVGPSIGASGSSISVLVAEPTSASTFEHWVSLVEARDAQLEAVELIESDDLTGAFPAKMRYLQHYDSTIDQIIFRRQLILMTDEYLYIVTTTQPNHEALLEFDALFLTVLDSFEVARISA